jgi:hypothetical protein
MSPEQRRSLPQLFQGPFAYEHLLRTTKAVHAKFRSPPLVGHLSAHKTRQRRLLRHAMTFCRLIEVLKRNVATVDGHKYRDVRPEEDGSLPL